VKAIAFLLAAMLVVPCCMPTGADRGATHRLPPGLRDIGFEQRLGESIPLDVVFRDELGEAVRLGEYFDTKPVILVLAYYECPMLCGLVRDGLAQSLRTLAFAVGEQYVVITVSVNPRDTPAHAIAKKVQTLRSYARPGASEGWHFLTGEEASIRQLTQAVGFQYAYDAANGQFAHAAGLVVLTARGEIARYLYGLEFAPKDVRLALIEAAAGQIGSPMDQLVLFCYQYDPATGQYGLVIMNVLRLAGLMTVVVLGGFMIAMFRHERHKLKDRSG
jgi:protein SCO1/2